jgi:hypothetical protein
MDRRLLARALAVALALATVACGPRRHDAAALAGAGYRTVPIGLCEDYPEESTSFDTVRADMAALRALGIDHLRVSFPWDSIEPAEGRFEWSFWDRFVDIAVGEYGITLLPYVAYTPEWAGVASEAPVWTRPPRDDARFAAFVRALVERYRDRIHSWEIWNEPDNPAYWSGDVTAFAHLLDAGAAAVRAADPTARVVLGGIAWNTQFVAALFAEHHAAAAVDVVNLHSYAETWSNDPIESLAGYVARVAAIIDRYGDREALWAAEVGYSSYRDGARVSDRYTATHAYEHTADYQADALVRMLAVLLASGRVSLIAWYEVRDLPAEAEVIGDVNNRHLGVLTAEGAPKPAFAALAFAHTLFDQPLRSLDDDIQVATGGAALATTAQVHAFERGDGSVVVVAWLPTHDAEASTEPVADLRRTDLAVTLPRALQPAVPVFDERGSERARIAATVADGATTLPLRLRGGEVSIAVAAPAR